MTDLKMKVETETVIYPEEYANTYKQYLDECAEYGENPQDLKEWLENELADDYQFSLWDSEITNFDEIYQEVKKYYEKQLTNKIKYDIIIV